MIFCPPLKHDNKPVIDYKGAALLTVLLATLILAVDNTEIIFADLMDATGISLLALRVIMFSIVAVSLFGFIHTERKAEQPILPLKFFKSANYIKLIIVATLFGGAFMGSILYLTQFNQQVFGATPTESGLMLLPMVAGIMVSSIGSGQLISRIGRYKIFMQVGLVVATIGMIALTTLGPDSQYIQEAIIMAFMGLGLGVVMPTLNLAIQNEFSQNELGASTSSNQLFRSLGSTVGTAVFGAMLTAGFVAHTATIKELPYLETISQSPAAERLGDLKEANTLLNLNMPDIKSEITASANEAFDSLPAQVAAPAKEEFAAQQTEFNDQVVDAFSNSLRDIFIVASVLMAVSAVAVFTLKERPLKAAKPGDTPGEVH